MNAEIITIGDEILIGQILDSNSKYIAESLNTIGISVSKISSIPDDTHHIIKALNDAQTYNEVIIITGGLGPTKDDITKHTLVKYFNDKFVFNKKIESQIKEMFAKINYPFTEINRNQALIPSKCIPLENKLGTAPGMWFDTNGKIIVSLPGVPYEMKGLLKDSVLSRLKEKFNLPYIIHKTILTYGIGESMLAEKIESWENNLPKAIKLAYLPSYGMVRLRLSARGNDKKKIDKTINSELEKLKIIFNKDEIFFEDDKDIETQLAYLLTKKNKTLSTAESCTGGNIAKRITSIAGASKFFTGSIIAYNASIKINELNVEKRLIEEFSIVSSQVAEAMARGIQQKFQTNYAIATTGNAGPTKDETDKTVGTVFVALATPTEIFSKEYYFGKPREKVIERASNKAFEMLYKELLK